MIQIPNNIKHLRFVRVLAGKKAAFETDWQKHTYTYDEMVKYLKNGENYGVVCNPDEEIGMIDADHKEYIMAVENNLPETFSVQSSSDQKRHFYYKIKNWNNKKNKIILVNPDDRDNKSSQGGDIRFGNFYVVGPGSIHPDTNTPYTVISNCPIAEVDFKDIDTLLQPYYKVETVSSLSSREFRNYPLPIKTVLDFYNITLNSSNGEECFCPHPIHGSENGTNFGVNLVKNVWCCRRCSSGGGVIKLVALLEKYIDCSDCSSELPDHIYDQTIEIINTKFNVDLYKEKKLPLNDTYNAMIFSKDNKNRLAYCDSLGGWVYYNSQYWETDSLSKVNEFANDVYNTMVSQAPTWVPVINKNDSDEDIKIKENIIRSWKNHVTRTGNRFSLEAMINVAKKDLSIRPEQFDANKNLLCLKNGEYDLNTMTFYPFRPESMLTKQANYSYDPNATCPNWERFLNIIFQGDTDTIRYIQKCVGYSLTDDVSEQPFFILYGGGSNGKSTFVNTIRHGMGSYACTTPVSSLIEKKNEGIPNDIARLRSMRLVATSETDYARVLDVATIKRLTSTDPISARFLNREFFEFQPTFKIFFSTNHKPTIKVTDDGCWRRLKLIPFNYKFDGADKIINYEALYLLPELSGILNWVLDGYKMYKKEGLKESKFVLDAIKEYKEEEDLMGIFLEENCIKDDSFSNIIVKSELYKYYVRVTELDKGYPLGKKNFFEKILSHGFYFKRISSGDHKGKFGCVGLICKDNFQIGLGNIAPYSYKVADVCQDSGFSE